MQAESLIKMAIVITVLLLFSVYCLSNHSGITVTDITIEKNNTTSTYDFSYFLRLGRHFEKLNCEYTIYSSENKTLFKNKTTFKNINMGSFSISENTNISIKEKPSKIEFKIYPPRIDSEENQMLREIYSHELTYNKNHTINVNVKNS